MRRLLLLALVVAAMLTACSDEGSSPPPSATAGATASASASPPVDGTIDPLGFGGTDPVHVKSNPDPISGVSVLKDVRAGGHPEQGGWDRVVFEFDKDPPEADIEYKTSVLSCGPPAGAGAGHGDPWRCACSRRTHTPGGPDDVKSQDVTGPGNVVLQVKQYCDFEAVNQWAIGVKAIQRFKVTTLQNPTRLVIDIKW
jgi:hypothetical protein